MVDDRLWELIAPLIPPQAPPGGPAGRTRIDDRAALKGIVLLLRASVPRAEPARGFRLRVRAHHLAQAAAVAKG
jgi:transposase